MSVVYPSGYVLWHVYSVCLAGPQRCLPQAINGEWIQHRASMIKRLPIDSGNDFTIDNAVEILRLHDRHRPRNVEINNPLLDYPGPIEIMRLPVWAIVSNCIWIAGPQRYPADGICLRQRDERYKCG